MVEKIIRLLDTVLQTVLIRWLHLSFLEKYWSNFMQFVKFCVVGVINTAVYYLCYLLLLKLGVQYLVASIIGYLISVVNAYYWNERYVFANNGETRRSIWKSFLKTLLSYSGTTLVLANALLFVEVSLLHWSETIAPFFNLIITIPLNFLMNKFWAFKTNKQRND